MSWTPKPLGEILEQSGRDRAGDQDLPVLSITMKHGLVDQVDKFKKRVASSDTSNYRVAYKNELVVGFPIDEGVLGFQTKYPAGIVSPAYDIWKLRSEVDAHIPFLERYFRSAQARRSYASRMKGAVARRRSLTKMDFLELEIPWPPLDDQIRIAHLLGRVEGLISHRKQHLQQLDDLLKSMFLEMFGDPVRNEKRWEATTIGQIIKVASGNGLVAQDMNTDGPYKVYGGNGVNGTHTEYMFDLPTLVIGRVGYYCGSVHITEPKSWVTDNALYVKEFLRKTDLVFLKHLLATHDLNKAAGRAAQPLVSGSRIYPIRTIDVPFENQRAFAAIVERVEALKCRYLQSLTDLEALYGSLSQQAYMGELDLSRVALPAGPVEGEEPVAAALPARITTPVIELPETDLLLPALRDRKQLAPLLRFWLEAYRTLSGRSAFSLEHFMVAAQNRLAELHPENDLEWVASDYESIKTWVFEALAAGALMQAFDDDGNRIELKATAEQSLA
jgi:type I restriction enzyme S subunit